MVVALLSFYEVNLSDSPAFDGEPVVAVNPVDPNNIVVAWLSAAFGTSVITVRYSTDGGLTWSTSRFMPHVVSGFRSADPAVAFAEDGTLYLAYIDYSEDSGFVVLTTSTDGGATWSSPRIVVRYDEAPDYPIDRPWIAVSGPHIYITTLEARVMEATAPYHLYVKASHDGGISWGPITEVGDSSNYPDSVRTMGQMALRGDSIVYIGYFSYNPSHYPLPRHMLAVSEDGGETFSYRTVMDLTSAAVSDPVLKKGSPLVRVPSSDVLIVTRIDASFGDPDAVAQRSEDGGLTWEPPFRLNDDPVGNGVYQDMLWGCAKDSIVAFFWRDRRSGGTGRTVPFEIYGTLSHDGGYTFGSNFVVSGEPSVYDTLLTISGNDFLSCAVGDTAIYVVWGDLRDTTSHIDVYLAVVSVRAVSVREGVPEPTVRGEGTYDASGRRRDGGIGGVYFEVGGGRVRKVIRR